MDKVIRSAKGTLRREAPLSEIQVPNLWHIAHRTADNLTQSDRDTILECWYLCHDLLANIRAEAAGETI